MIVTADLYRVAFRLAQLLDDLCFVLLELLRDAAKLLLEFLVLALLGESLGPVQRKVEVSSAVIEFSDFA